MTGGTAMKWFMNLSTQNKLLAGFGLMFIMLAAVIITAYQGLDTLRKSHRKLYETEIPITKNILKFRSQMNREWFVMDMLIKASDPMVRESWIRNIRQESQDGDELLHEILELGRGNPDYVKVTEKMMAERKIFNDIREKELIPAILQGNAKRSLILLEAQTDLYERIREMAIELYSLSDQNDKKAWLDTSQTFKNVTQSFVVLGILALIILVGVAAFLTRIIAGPLKDLAQAAEQVSYGDLTVAMPAGSRTDEVGRLMLTFGMMISGLKMMTQELYSAIEVLDSASEKLLGDVEKAPSKEDPVIAKVMDTALNIKELVQKLKKLVEQYKV
jgi:methyl-accepting chemotaxis protein